MKNSAKKIFILVLLLMWFLPRTSSAAEIFFNSNKSNFFLEEEFLVQVFLNTEDISINALEGTVLFPDEFLELKEIRDGNSSVNFWVEKPNNYTDGKISFSGITTGGFSGDKRFLFGMVFNPKKSGEGSLEWSDVKILENDGLGSKAGTKEIPFVFSISTEINKSGNLNVEDADSPEKFNPFIGNDPSIFDGKFFLVFSTVDKGTGIDHYAIREGFWGEYINAESPYLLKDQSLSSNIYVKAFDKSGNERVIKVKAQNRNLLLELLIILGILLIIACVFLFKKIWLRRA